VVVVYKIDRLSRALVDFDKLIEPPSVHGRLHVARANWGRISSPRTWRPRPTFFGPVANSMPNRDLTSLNSQSYPDHRTTHPESPLGDGGPWEDL
jgi:hypothetical protein